MNGKNRQFGRKQERRSSTDLVKVTPGWPKGIQGRNISNSYITGIFDHNDPLGRKWPLAERQTPGNFIQTCNKQDLHWQCNCWKKYFNRLQNLACFVSPPFQTAVFFFHGTVEVGRHLWRSCGPAHCSEVGHPEQAGWPVIRFWVSPRILHNLCSNLLLWKKHFLHFSGISCISVYPLPCHWAHCCHESGSLFFTLPIKYLYTLVWSPHTFSSAAWTAPALSVSPSMTWKSKSTTMNSASAWLMCCHRGAKHTQIRLSKQRYD